MTTAQDLDMNIPLLNVIKDINGIFEEQIPGLTDESPQTYDDTYLPMVVMQYFSGERVMAQKVQTWLVDKTYEKMRQILKKEPFELGIVLTEE